MFHPKGKYRARVVIARLLFLGVEAHALADDGLARTSRAPDGKRHFEADGEDAGGGMARARAERVSCTRILLELLAGKGGKGREWRELGVEIDEGEARTFQLLCWPIRFLRARGEHSWQCISPLRRYDETKEEPRPSHVCEAWSAKVLRRTIRAY